MTQTGASATVAEVATCLQHFAKHHKYDRHVTAVSSLVNAKRKEFAAECVVKWSDFLQKERERKQWRKVVYERQDVPDNYVDYTFMQGLRKNTDVQPYSYPALVSYMGVFTQQICAIISFYGIFWAIRDKAVRTENIVAVGLCITLCAYAITMLFSIRGYGSGQRALKLVKMSGMVFATLLWMSPILHSLTSSIASDTVYATSVCMMVINLACHTYVPSRGGSVRVTGRYSVSVNAAIFASVCLGSRLPSAIDVFCLVVCAMQLFVLLPFFRYRVQRKMRRWAFDVLSLVHILGTVGLLYTLNKRATLLVTIGTVTSLTLGVPALLMSHQQYKNEIRGPWDEAVVEDRDKESS